MDTGRAGVRHRGRGGPNTMDSTAMAATRVAADQVMITLDQAGEYAALRAAERRRQRKRELRAMAPTATGARVVSMLRAMLPRLADHVAIGAVEPGDLRELRGLLDDAVTVAIGRLRSQGYSWPEVGRELGISHQAAHKRWQRHQNRQAAK